MVIDFDFVAEAGGALLTKLNYSDQIIRIIRILLKNMEPHGKARGP